MEKKLIIAMIMERKNYVLLVLIKDVKKYLICEFIYITQRIKLADVKIFYFSR